MKKLNTHIQNKDQRIADITIFSTESMKERTKGLLNLPILQPNQGLLLNHCRSVHTMGMPYTIDVVYLTKKNKIIKIVSNLKPYRMSGCLFANRTLELLAGEADRLSLSTGMTLQLPHDY